MPRENIDYSNTVIYKLVCNDLNIKDLYVGHTTNFTKRKNRHKYSCTKEHNRDYNYNVYQYIRSNGGWDNWSMIEIEKFPCNDTNEALKRERYWYETLNANLNNKYPNRTQEEYNNVPEVKEHKSEWCKTYRPKYREENRVILRIRNKIYRDTHRAERRIYEQKYRDRLKENRLKVENNEVL